MIEKETLVLKYFEGTLSIKEQILFDKLLADDADFKSQIEFEKNVKTAIGDGERSILKKKLQHFESARTKTTSKKINLWKPLSIAASIAILLAASWYMYTSQMFSGESDLYVANYEIYPNTVYTITRGDVNDNSIERKAFEAYESEKYEIAINNFEDLKEQTGLDYVDFYLAQSLLANGDEEKAIAIFQKIRSINSDYKAEAMWYEALAQLKLMKNQEVIAILLVLQKEGSYKKQEVKDLLEKLK